LVNNIWIRRAYILSMVGCIQFIVLTFIAMLFYRGGTQIDPNTSGYMFFYNFFSDLGLTISYSGESNTISFILFFISISFIGLSYIPFFLTISSTFQNNDIERKMSIACSIIGVFSSVMFIGIAFTPENVFSDIHSLFVFSAFFLAFIASLILAYLTYFNKNYSIIFPLGYMIFSCLIVIYGLIGLLFFNNYTTEGIFIRATTQKVVIYYLMICFFFQNYGYLKKRT